MTIVELAREIARREGKKKEVNIAQIKEVLAVLSDIFVELEDDELCKLLKAIDNNGKRRAKAKTKAKK